MTHEQSVCVICLLACGRSADSHWDSQICAAFGSGFAFAFARIWKLRDERREKRDEIQVDSNQIVWPIGASPLPISFQVRLISARWPIKQAESEPREATI